MPKSALLNAMLRWRTRQNGNHDAAGGISAKFPTSAIAVLHTSSPWRDLGPGGSVLVTFHVPR